MKPMPTSRRRLRRPLGGRESLRPSASSRSALPQAARRRAVAVLGDSAPPRRRHDRRHGGDVEGPLAVAARPGGVHHFAVGLDRDAWSRIMRASPPLSSAVSPFMRSAVRKAPIWAGVASPSTISCIAAAASCSVRSSRSTRRAIASLMAISCLLSPTGRQAPRPARRGAHRSKRLLPGQHGPEDRAVQPQEVRQQAIAVLGHHRFRWNWTPSTGSSRWRSPMIRPSSVHALTSRSAGRESRSTINEW